VFGSVAGDPVGSELRKFGFTILHAIDHKVTTDRIIGQLQTALREVETFLEPMAGAFTVDSGLVSLNEANTTGTVGVTGDVLAFGNTAPWAPARAH
jgi:hypothetical protein